MPTHYDTLEVSEHASAEVIRAAYRSLMQRHHPDRHAGDPVQIERAAQITQAYEVLSHAEHKARYDRALAEQRWLERGGVAPPLTAGPPSTDAANAPSHAPAAAAGRAPLATPRHRTAPSAHTAPPQRLPAWLWLLGLAVLLAAFGLVWRQATQRANPAHEWQQLRTQMAATDVPEAEKRAAHQRKQALLQRHPELQAQDQAERLQDLQARTVDLLTAPLVVRLGGNAPQSERADEGTLRIPRISVLMGSFDTGPARALLLRHRERAIAELTERLSRLPASRAASPEASAYLQRQVLLSLAQSLQTQPDQDYPSTWHESPGRYGPVEVVFPEGYELLRPTVLPSAGGGGGLANGGNSAP